MGRLRILLALVALCALAVAAGCSGGGDEDLTEGRSPAELLAETARRGQELDTFRVAIAGTVTVGAQGDAGGLATFAQDPLTIEGEGRADPPERAAVDATVDLSGLPVQVSVIKVGGALFLSAIGQDIRLEVPPEQVERFDPALLMPTVARWMTEPRETGREDVQGEPAVKLSGGIDPQAVIADIGPLLGQAGTAAPEPAAVEAALRDGTVDVWVGTEDLRPRRVRVVLDAPDAAALASGLRSLAVDLTVTVTGYDEPVEIEAPADARSLSLDELGSLAGG